MDDVIRSFKAGTEDNGAAKKAALILEHAHISAAALLKAFDLVRTARAGTTEKPTVGMTTDEELSVLI